MRLLLTGAVALLFASPAQAQLAPPNADGVTFAHVHLNVTDIDAHTKIRNKSVVGTRPGAERVRLTLF